MNSTRLSKLSKEISEHELDSSIKVLGCAIKSISVKNVEKRHRKPYQRAAKSNCDTEIVDQGRPPEITPEITNKH